MTPFELYMCITSGIFTGLLILAGPLWLIHRRRDGGRR
jgi:hypothetical protein